METTTSDNGQPTIATTDHPKPTIALLSTTEEKTVLRMKRNHKKEEERLQFFTWLDLFT